MLSAFQAAANVSETLPNWAAASALELQTITDPIKPKLEGCANSHHLKWGPLPSDEVGKFT